MIDSIQGLRAFLGLGERPTISIRGGTVRPSTDIARTPQGAHPSSGDPIGNVLAREGGYANHPNDHGGETNMGITKATARQFGYLGPMRGMTETIARNIYKTMFDKSGAGSLPPGLQEHYFDTVVHSGPARAAKILNQSAGDPNMFRAIRLRFVERLAERDPSQQVFLRGWRRRINSI